MSIANRICVLVLTAILVTGVLSVKATGQSGPTIFVTVAEGFTSEKEGDGVRVAYRMFSLPDFEKICATAPNPAKLVANTAPIEIRLGEPFALSRIVVLARDGAGGLLQGVPISLEVEDRGSFFLRSDAIAESKLQPLQPGRVSFRARTICPGTSVSTMIPAIIQ